jgi:hypothetical protein
MNVWTFPSSSSDGSGRWITLIGTEWTGASSDREKMEEVGLDGLGASLGAEDEGGVDEFVGRSEGGRQDGPASDVMMDCTRATPCDL